MCIPSYERAAEGLTNVRSGTHRCDTCHMSRVRADMCADSLALGVRLEKGGSTDNSSCARSESVFTPVKRGCRILTSYIVRVESRRVTTMVVLCAVQRMPPQSFVAPRHAAPPHPTPRHVVRCNNILVEDAITQSGWKVAGSAPGTRIRCFGVLETRASSPTNQRRMGLVSPCNKPLR